VAPPIAENGKVCPTAKKALLGVICVWVMVIIPELSDAPTLSVTVTVVVPAEAANNNPLALIVATVGFEELHV
jgi:hypothetical protein